MSTLFRSVLNGYELNPTATLFGAFRNVYQANREGNTAAVGTALADVRSQLGAFGSQVSNLHQEPEALQLLDASASAPSQAQEAVALIRKLDFKLRCGLTDRFLEVWQTAEKEEADVTELHLWVSEINKAGGAESVGLEERRDRVRWERVLFQPMAKVVPITVLMQHPELFLVPEVTVFQEGNELIEAQVEFMLQDVSQNLGDLETVVEGIKGSESFGPFRTAFRNSPLNKRAEIIDSITAFESAYGKAKRARGAEAGIKAWVEALQALANVPEDFGLRTQLQQRFVDQGKTEVREAMQLIAPPPPVVTKNVSINFKEAGPYLDVAEIAADGFLTQSHVSDLDNFSVVVQPKPGLFLTVDGVEIREKQAVAFKPGLEVKAYFSSNGVLAGTLQLAEADVSLGEEVTTKNYQWDLTRAPVSADETALGLFKRVPTYKYYPANKVGDGWPAGFYARVELKKGHSILGSSSTIALPLDGKYPNIDVTFLAIPVLTTDDKNFLLRTFLDAAGVFRITAEEIVEVAGVAAPSEELAAGETPRTVKDRAIVAALQAEAANCFRNVKARDSDALRPEQRAWGCTVSGDIISLRFAEGDKDTLVVFRHDGYNQTEIGRVRKTLPGIPVALDPTKVAAVQPYFTIANATTLEEQDGKTTLRLVPGTGLTLRIGKTNLSAEGDVVVDKQAIIEVRLGDPDVLIGRVTIYRNDELVSGKRYYSLTAVEASVAIGGDSLSRYVAQAHYRFRDGSLGVMCELKPFQKSLEPRGEDRLWLHVSERAPQAIYDDHFKKVVAEMVLKKDERGFSLQHQVPLTTGVRAVATDEAGLVKEIQAQPEVVNDLLKKARGALGGTASGLVSCYHGLHRLHLNFTSLDDETTKGVDVFQPGVDTPLGTLRRVPKRDDPPAPDPSRQPPRPPVVPRPEPERPPVVERRFQKKTLDGHLIGVDVDPAGEIRFQGGKTVWTGKMDVSPEHTVEILDEAGVVQRNFTAGHYEGVEMMQDDGIMVVTNFVGTKTAYRLQKSAAVGANALEFVPDPAALRDIVLVPRAAEEADASVGAAKARARRKIVDLTDPYVRLYGLKYREKLPRATLDAWETLNALAWLNGKFNIDLYADSESKQDQQALLDEAYRSAAGHSNIIAALDIIKGTRRPVVRVEDYRHALDYVDEQDLATVRRMFDFNPSHSRYYQSFVIQFANIAANMERVYAEYMNPEILLALLEEARTVAPGAPGEYVAKRIGKIYREAGAHFDHAKHLEDEHVADEVFKAIRAISDAVKRDAAAILSHLATARVRPISLGERQRIFMYSVTGLQADLKKSKLEVIPKTTPPRSKVRLHFEVKPTYRAFFVLNQGDGDHEEGPLLPNADGYDRELTDRHYLIVERNLGYGRFERRYYRWELDEDGDAVFSAWTPTRGGHEPGAELGVSDPMRGLESPVASPSLAAAAAAAGVQKLVGAAPARAPQPAAPRKLPELPELEWLPSAREQPVKQAPRLVQPPAKAGGTPDGTPVQFQLAPIEDSWLKAVFSWTPVKDSQIRGGAVQINFTTKKGRLGWGAVPLIQFFRKHDTKAIAKFSSEGNHSFLFEDGDELHVTRSDETRKYQVTFSRQGQKLIASIRPIQ